MAAVQQSSYQLTAHLAQEMQALRHAGACELCTIYGRHNDPDVSSDKQGEEGTSGSAHSKKYFLGVVRLSM